MSTAAPVVPKVVGATSILTLAPSDGVGIWLVANSKSIPTIVWSAPSVPLTITFIPSIAPPLNPSILCQSKSISVSA